MSGFKGTPGEWTADEYLYDNRPNGITVVSDAMSFRPDIPYDEHGQRVVPAKALRTQPGKSHELPEFDYPFATHYGSRDAWWIDYSDDHEGRMADGPFDDEATALAEMLETQVTGELA